MAKYFQKVNDKDPWTKCMEIVVVSWFLTWKVYSLLGFNSNLKKVASYLRKHFLSRQNFSCWANDFISSFCLNVFSLICNGIREEICCKYIRKMREKIVIFSFECNLTYSFWANKGFEKYVPRFDNEPFFSFFHPVAFWVFFNEVPQHNHFFKAFVSYI